jgi:DNA-binding transcriptional ArsR family regulator
VNAYRMAELGLLLGEPARAAMLSALMDGRALSAGELAIVAGVAPQTASGHLARLTEAGLLKVERQGRHRYHRLASADIAQLLETFMQVASASALPPGRSPLIGPRDVAMRRARTCYDHLAGELGVALCDALVARGAVEFDDGAGIVTAAGVDMLREAGVSLDNVGKRRSARPLCRPCLDWSERRPHLAGKLGAALCSHFLGHDLLRRVDGSRALRVTGKGRSVLRDVWGIEAY